MAEPTKDSVGPDSADESPLTPRETGKMDLPAKTRDWQTATKVVILLPLISWIIYDFAAFAYGGFRATISTTVGNWLALYGWVVVLMGLFGGHVMASGVVAEVNWRHWILFFGSIAVGYWATMLTK